MLAFRFAIIFLAAARLIPRGAQDSPSQIEIILPFGRSSRRTGRFGGIFDHPCDYPYGETDGEANLWRLSIGTLLAQQHQTMYVI